MDPPKVSVVIPAYGVASTLEHSARSAITNGDVTLELIVVDDASVDGSSAVADQLGAELGATVVHRSTTGGPGAARNDGLACAVGEFVLFLDGDDELCEGALSRLLQGFAPGIVATLGRFRAVNEDGSELDIGTWAHEQLHPVVRRKGHFVTSPDGFSSEAMLTRLVTPPPGAVLVRRDAARAVGGYDLRLRRSEDIDFLVRLAAIGGIVAVDETVLVYRRRSRQRSAATRRRQFGRQWTLLMLIVRSPNSSESTNRSRGVANHHLDRATTRWRYGRHSLADLAFVLRSLLLAATFRTVGALVAKRPRS